MHVQCPDLLSAARCDVGHVKHPKSICLQISLAFPTTSPAKSKPHHLPTLTWQARTFLCRGEQVATCSSLSQALLRQSPRYSVPLWLCLLPSIPLKNNIPGAQALLRLAAEKQLATEAMLPRELVSSQKGSVSTAIPLIQECPFAAFRKATLPTACLLNCFKMQRFLTSFWLLPRTRVGVSGPSRSRMLGSVPSNPACWAHTKRARLLQEFGVTPLI